MIDRQRERDLAKARWLLSPREGGTPSDDVADALASAREQGRADIVALAIALCCALDDFDNDAIWDPTGHFLQCRHAMFDAMLAARNALRLATSAPPRDAGDQARGEGERAAAQERADVVAWLRGDAHTYYGMSTVSLDEIASDIAGGVIDRHARKPGGAE